MLQATSSQVMACLRNWNTPIGYLSSLAGVSVKPYHLALLGAAFVLIAKKANLALHRSRNAEKARRRKVELEREVAQIPQLDRVRLFSIPTPLYSPFPLFPLC